MPAKTVVVRILDAELAAHLLHSKPTLTPSITQFFIIFLYSRSSQKHSETQPKPTNQPVSMSRTLARRVQSKTQGHMLWP